MAFTGAASVVQVSDSICRITGLSLAAGATGTIALFGHAAGPGVILPDGFLPKAYEGPAGPVTLSDALDVDAKAGAVGTAVAIPVAVVKTGVDASDWVATLTNTHASTATPNLEIYVKNHT